MNVAAASLSDRRAFEPWPRTREARPTLLTTGSSTAQPLMARPGRRALHDPLRPWGLWSRRAPLAHPALEAGCGAGRRGGGRVGAGAGRRHRGPRECPMQLGHPHGPSHERGETGEIHLHPGHHAPSPCESTITRVGAAAPRSWRAGPAAGASARRAARRRTGTRPPGRGGACGGRRRIGRARPGSPPRGGGGAR